MEKRDFLEGFVCGALLVTVAWMCAHMLVSWP